MRLIQRAEEVVESNRGEDAPKELERTDVSDDTMSSARTPMRDKDGDREPNFLQRFEDEPSVPPIHMRSGTRGVRARSVVEPPDLSKLGDEDYPVDPKVQAILDDLEG